MPGIIPLRQLLSLLEHFGLELPTTSVSIVDIAPTIARIMGVKLEDADGLPLDVPKVQGVKVILIIIGSLGSWMLKTLAGDIEPRFIMGGDYEAEAISVYPSITPTAIASIVTGAFPHKHGVLGPEPYRIGIKTLVECARERGYKVGITSWSSSSLIRLIASLADEHVITHNSDKEVAEAIDFLIKRGHDLVVAHFLSLDVIGHEQGPLSADWVKALVGLDHLIGGLINSLKQRGGYVVFITSDHGMHQEASGGGCGTLLAEDMIVPITIHVIW